MSEPIKIPDLLEISRLSEQNRKRRLARETELFPVHLEKWRKRVVDQLLGAVRTEVKWIKVVPPPSEEDIHMRQVLDKKAVRELTSELRFLGYVVSPEEGGDQWCLKIGWN